MKYIAAIALTLALPCSMHAAAKNTLVSAPKQPRGAFSLYPAHQRTPEKRAKRDELEQSITKEHREICALSTIITEIETTGLVRDGEQTLALLEKYEPILDVYEKSKKGELLSEEEVTVTQSAAYKSLAALYEQRKQEAGQIERRY